MELRSSHSRSRSRQAFFVDEKRDANNLPVSSDPESIREAQRAQAALDFMTAVENRDMERARALLDEQLVNVNIDDGWALKTAIGQQNVDMVHMLVAGYNAVVDDLVLEVAVSSGNADLVEFLFRVSTPSSLVVCKQLVLKALFMGRIDLVTKMLALPVCSSVLQAISKKEWKILFNNFRNAGNQSPPNVVDMCRFLIHQNVTLPNVALRYCADWAIEHCSFEMIQFLREIKFSTTKVGYRPEDVLRKSIRRGCKQEFIDSLLTLQKRNFQPHSRTLNAAVESGNIPLFQNLVERGGIIDEENILTNALETGQVEMLRVLLDEYGDEYGISPTLFDNGVTKDIVRNKQWDVLRFLYERNLLVPPRIDNHTHLFVLRKTIQAQRPDIVAFAAPFTLLARGGVATPEERAQYEQIVQLAAERPSTKIIETLFHTYLPREEDILLALRHAKTAEMFRFLMHRPLLDDDGNMETIRLTDAQVQEMIEDAIERGREFVLEYFFSPAELQNFFLDTKNPQFVDRFVSKAPEYRGRMPSHRETEYLYKQRETDKQDKI